MTETNRSVLRIPVEGIDCRCARELIAVRVRRTPGVLAASVGQDDTLTVLADDAKAGLEDILAVLIDTGYVPDGSVAVARVTRKDIPGSEEPVVVAPEAAPPLESPALAYRSRRIAAAEHQQVEGSREDETSRRTAVATSEPSFPGVAETEPVAPFARAVLLQRLEVKVSDGFYPNRLVVAAHIPVEIAFGEGHGCMARVLFEDFGVDADLTDGGAVVHLPAMEPGEYRFSCGMHMVFGTLVVEG